MSVTKTIRRPHVLAAVLCGIAATAAAAETRSRIELGDEPSQRAGGVQLRNVKAESLSYSSGGESVTATGSRIVSAAGEGAGWIAFDAAVSPDRQNYVTLRVWGGEKTWGPLHLRLDEGDVDLGNIWLFITSEPPAPGKWIYRTFPIPIEVTRGKTNVRLRLQNALDARVNNPETTSTAKPAERYKPTFAVYGIYAHDEPFFEPPSDVKKGEPFKWGSPREKPADYPSIEERLKERALNDIEYVMKLDLNRVGYGPALHRRVTRGLWALGVIYHTKWSGHYKDESIPARVRDGIDAQVKAMAEMGGDPGVMYYRGWGSFGNVGLAYAELHEQFAQRGWLDEPITLKTPDGERTLPRRKAYGDFFHDAFEWRRGDRRDYTNQPLHISWTMYNTQLALQKLGDPRALTPKQALWYVHEGTGLAPLRTREFGIDGDAAGFPFYTVTDKGLTRELGYVDGYGELTKDLVKLTRLTGDPKVKEQATKFVDTRSIFRMPYNDADGFAILRGIGVMSWRDPNHPFRIHYNGIHEAAALRSPAAIRLAQLEIEHGRLYLLEPNPERNVHWNAVDAIQLYNDYLEVKQMPPTDHRLPMEPGQGDFVFGDEENGTFAFRHGEARVYGSFYFNYPPNGRAINDKGVLMLDTPDTQWVADVHFKTRTPPSGLFVDVKFPWGTRKFEQAPLPPGFSAWQESPPNSFDRREGLAYFYELKFGDYVIAMNTTEAGSYRQNAYTLSLPEGAKRPVDLRTGKPVEAGEAIEVGPRTTRVFVTGEK